MLSKEDYKNYLNQLYDIEAEMAKAYKECIDALEDSRIKQVFHRLHSDEMAHIVIVRNMARLFEL